MDKEPRKEDLTAEILRNLTGKPKGKCPCLRILLTKCYSIQCLALC